ncbi:MAG: hypothetical protein QXS03_01475 [Candidatus Micrarchaeaceae archaeon]
MKTPTTSEQTKEPAKKLIKVPQSMYTQLEAMKIIPEQPFYKVIKMLLDFYEQNKGDAK